MRRFAPFALAALLLLAFAGLVTVVGSVTEKESKEWISASRIEERKG